MGVTATAYVSCSARSRKHCPERDVRYRGFLYAGAEAEEEKEVLEEVVASGATSLCLWDPFLSSWST